MRTPQEAEALERIDKDLRIMENTFQSDIGSEQPNHHIHSPYTMTTASCMVSFEVRKCTIQSVVCSADY